MKKMRLFQIVINAMKNFEQGNRIECWDGGGCWAVDRVDRECLSEEVKSELNPAY